MSNENQGCLVAILKLFGINIGPADSGGAEEQLPYRLRDNFLSVAELSFFHVLQSVAGERFHITTKVRISDLLYVVQRRTNMKYANKIDRKHVDFVLCEPKTMQPQLVIELDDSSHARKDRSDRDDLVDAAFAAAGFPVLHVTAKKAYSPDEIAQQIGEAMKETQFPPLQTSNTKSSMPTCPKCQVPMVERKAGKGAHKDKRFWGCPSYPKCREIVPID